MTEPTGRNPEPARDRDRIVNFSDGVFAIVITLLILTIEVPDIPPARSPKSCLAACSP